MAQKTVFALAVALTLLAGSETRAVELDYKNGEKARADLWHEYKAYSDILRRLGMIKK